MLLVHWIQSESVPDPPLHGSWCSFPTSMVLQRFFGHVGVCSVSSWQCCCCLLVHITHSPWHQLQGEGSSGKGGKRWVLKGQAQRSARGGCDGGGSSDQSLHTAGVAQAMWWETILVAVAWHGRRTLWPRPLPSTGAAGEVRMFGVLCDVFSHQSPALGSQVYILTYLTVYFLRFSHVLLATRAWSISEDSRTLNITESASQG